MWDERSVVNYTDKNSYIASKINGAMRGVDSEANTCYTLSHCGQRRGQCENCTSNNLSVDFYKQQACREALQVLIYNTVWGVVEVVARFVVLTPSSLPFCLYGTRCVQCSHEISQAFYTILCHFYHFLPFYTIL